MKFWAEYLIVIAALYALALVILIIDGGVR